MPPLLLVIALALPAAAFAEPEVSIEPRGGGFAVRAETLVDATPAVAWQVLTDYNRLADFVPDMRASRVISAPGAPLLVEQQGCAGFLMFGFGIDVVLEIEETPPSTLAFRAIRGNMRIMRGEWSVDGSAAGVTRLVYKAVLEPAFWVPPLIGPAILRRDISSRIAGVVREMVRRQGAVTLQLNTQSEK